MFMKKPTPLATWIAALFCIWLLASASAEEDSLMQAMREEMTRTLEELQMEGLESPYFVSYTVQDAARMSARASFGALLSSNENRSRDLIVEMRVGNPAFDNTNFSFGPSIQAAALPLGDNVEEIRRQIWLATDAAYKGALESLAAKRAALQNQTRSEELGDFSGAERFTYSVEPTCDMPSLRKMESLTRRLSELFTKMPEIKESAAIASAGHQRTYYLNSEGSSFIRNDPSARFGVRARTQAPDGTELHDFVAAYGNTWDEIADEEALTRQVKAMGQALAERRAAPVMDHYIGPVLFEGQAAAELLAQALAPRLVGARVPDMPRGFGSFPGSAENPFLDKIGARVLARTLSLVDDPTRQGAEFLGGRAVDDEGVATQATSLVENGILKTLLTTRNPVRGVEGSTGSRRGVLPAASNLILTTRRGMSREDMLAELMLLVEERQGAYGIIVRRLGNPGFRPDSAAGVSFPFGFRGPQQLNVEGTLIAYKVYADGREELIQTAELTGMTDSVFRDIVAASESSTVYTIGPADFGLRALVSFRIGGVTLPGAGVGREVVSLSVPDLLFEEVTLRKPSGNLPRPPVAGHPFFTD